MEKLIESYSFHSTPARSMGTRLWKALPSQNHCEKWFIPRNLLIIVIRLSIGSRWLNKRPTTTRRDVKLSSLQPLVNSEDGHPMLSISLTPMSIKLILLLAGCPVPIVTLIWQVRSINGSTPTSGICTYLRWMVNLHGLPSANLPIWWAVFPIYYFCMSFSINNRFRAPFS